MWHLMKLDLLLFYHKLLISKYCSNHQILLQMFQFHEENIFPLQFVESNKYQLQNPDIFLSWSSRLDLPSHMDIEGDVYQELDKSSHSNHSILQLLWHNFLLTPHLENIQGKFSIATGFLGHILSFQKGK